MPKSLSKRVHREVATVTPVTSVPQIVEEMAEWDVGDVIVVDDGDIVGIVTDRDVALAMRDSPDPITVTAEDIMTPDPVTVQEEWGTARIVDELREAGVRRAPVVDDEGELVGVVSLDDILVLLGREAGSVADLVEEQA